MAITTLPYPGMDFVPLDILTASELDQMVANIEAVNNASIGTGAIADSAITTGKIADGAITPAKFAESALEMTQERIVAHLNGTPVYERTITTTGANGTKNVNLGFTIGTALSIDGIWVLPSGVALPLNWLSDLNNAVRGHLTSTSTVQLTATTDRSSATVYITIRYTK